jgi:hypothetical protein
MHFKITSHSGFRGDSGPANAMEMLWQRLGPRRRETSFAKVGLEIRVKTDTETTDRTTREIRAEVERRAVFEIVRETCEGDPELSAEWFAVSYVD